MIVSTLIQATKAYLRFDVWCRRDSSVRRSRLILYRMIYAFPRLNFKTMSWLRYAQGFPSPSSAPKETLCLAMLILHCCLSPATIQRQDRLSLRHRSLDTCLWRFSVKRLEKFSRRATKWENFTSSETFYLFSGLKERENPRARNNGYFLNVAKCTGVKIYLSKSKTTYSRNKQITHKTT